MNGRKEKLRPVDGMETWFECIPVSGINPPRKCTAAEPDYHYHDYIELLYSVETDGDVYINGSCIHFKTGDIIVINSNELHDTRYFGKTKYLCVKFSPNVLYADEKSLFEYKYALPFLTDGVYQRLFEKDAAKRSGISMLCDEIIDEWTKHDYAYEMVIRSNILKIFSYILRRWKEQNVLGGDRKISDTIKKAMRYIFWNSSSATECMTAQYCGLSTNYFSYLFKHDTGKTFKEFLMSVRLKEAEKLLLSTDKSVTDIAMETGYSTSSHFIAEFKKHVGLTPKQFQKKLNC